MITSPLTPLVYLTAELKSRDLDSRILIAGYLLKRGFGCVVGQQWAITGNFAIAPKGCYLFKTLNVHQGNAMATIRTRGHIMVGADEEALCSTGDQSLESVHPLAMSSLDLVLAQDLAHRDLLAKAYPGTRITVTGNARVELLQKANARSVRPMDAPYILFNTNFPFTNGYMRPEVAATVVKDFKSDYDYEVARREHLVALIKWVVDNVQSHRIVIRPHPGEKVEPWQKLFRDHPNVVIVGRSDPVEWIAAAAVSIHSDSTTGLEAAIMKKPCLNISPAGFEHRADERLMRQINYTVAHAQDAIDPLMEYLTTKRGPLAQASGAIKFERDGAMRTARAIIGEFKRSGMAKVAPVPLPNWAPYPREDYQREKFTVSEAEARSRAETLFDTIGLKSFNLMTLDDSVFYFQP
jgi:surface carbohydrate biosynthesis protein